jgi:nitrite reductase/ring-hydroxylating ferredoxin subunit
MAAHRFPHPIPFGWFSVGRIDELTESVTTVDAFGGQVVVWRDSSGEYHVVDPVCPHLGAHLGVGGEVVGDCIRCPFHHWEFDAHGANTRIPYVETVNRKARVFTYPSHVANGHLIAWYHPDRSVAPTFEVPDKLGADMVYAGRFDRVVRSVWQEIAENSVDMSHFKYVHGMPEINAVGQMTIDGPFRVVESKQAFTTSKGPVTGEIVSSSLGAGIGHIEFRLFSTVTLISAMTPIDDDHVQVRFTFWHDGSDIAGKIAAPFSAEVERQFDQDIPIWESKTFLPVPALASTEKPVTEFRKWAAQFYAATP